VVRTYAARVPAVIEVVSVIDAAPSRVFDLKLDVDVHAQSVPASRETADDRQRREIRAVCVRST
jgi:hypothetical protein